MKLSIIIPVYNAELTIGRCLDSIPKNENVEVIVVDDGSVDESKDIITAYLHDVENYPNFYPVFLGERSGVSNARNKGMSFATGDYVTFLDADDEYYPGAVESMLDIISKRNEPVIQFNHSRVNFCNRKGFYYLNNLPLKWVLVWNKIYDRRFLLKHEIEFPKGLQFEEDRIFNLRCFNYLEGIVCVDPQTVIKHFDNKKSLCHSVDSREVLFLSEHLMGILTCSKPEVQAIARTCLADLWRSKNAIRIFGGGDS